MARYNKYWIFCIYNRLKCEIVKSLYGFTIMWDRAEQGSHWKDNSTRLSKIELDKSTSQIRIRVYYIIRSTVRYYLIIVLRVFNNLSLNPLLVAQTPQLKPLISCLNPSAQTPQLKSLPQIDSKQVKVWTFNFVLYCMWCKSTVEHRSRLRFLHLLLLLEREVPV